LVEWALAGLAAGGAALALRWLRAAALVALALVPLPTLAGHALDANQPWWSALADAVHLLGASVWVGGLLALAVAVPRAARGDGPESRRPARVRRPAAERRGRAVPARRRRRRGGAAHGASARAERARRAGARLGHAPTEAAPSGRCRAGARGRRPRGGALGA